ncbi:hypothetical protein GCM10010103_55810 [Streptomyces paradoxus]|uniref:Transcriptional regulator with XRE-family HTH domain n=1 Tax=Streptomyces paradoxus TaxID=66375 RepID=A0A7W9THC4_9ACTN|nr:helix-turn-helix transcriptional regulator [Streptomyces paradoxus]MBB6079412.1 transcriptional regulator with XRE-family HTH domain [Streptomyces paradoxus]
MGNQEESLPHRAQDAGEFIAAMRHLKERSGLTYRQLERRAAERGETLARSTLADVLRGRTLPRPELLAAFVRACGDDHRLEGWLAAREEVAGRAAAEGSATVRRTSPHRSAGRKPALMVAVAATVALLLAGGVGAWQLYAPGGGEPTGKAGASRTAGPPHLLQSSAPSPPSAGSGRLSGWVRIRPVTAPRLCLTDGRVRDRRYTPLVAVQRPCDQVAPQDTLLEPMGGDSYRIQWHHPDYGMGCLKVLSRGPGAGLLEPMDDCAEDSRFHIEPSGPYVNGTYVLRVDGQGCVGIRGSGRSEGTEAVMERCVGKGGQVFTIEPAR